MTVTNPLRVIRMAALAMLPPAMLPPLTACDQVVGGTTGDQAAGAEQAPYQLAVVERRDITVAVEAAGVIEPLATVEVKSKASGEILSLPVDTGDRVAAGALLATIDPRVLDNALQQAQANLEVAKARLANSSSQLERINKLYQNGSLSKSDWEKAALDYAQANSDVVRGEIQVENAVIGLEDTKVVAPAAGTIIERFVEQGQVISSPMGDVGGGTLLLRMADLSKVRVRMLVDEIDIGKVRPGSDAAVIVAAYENQPFRGKVIKVEPQAVAQQNVTMFPVLIDLDNSAGRLKPGMNAEVELLVARRVDALTIPAAAVRTPEDIYAAGSVLGIAVDEVRRMLDAAPRPPNAGERAGGEGERPPEDARQKTRAAMARARNGERLTDAERKLVNEARKRFAGRGGAGSESRKRRSAVDSWFGGDYLVFALRDDAPVALRVRTGITDLDRTEVTFGLDEGDQVLILPSAFLVRAQESLRKRFGRWGGIPGLNRNSGRRG